MSQGATSNFFDSPTIALTTPKSLAFIVGSSLFERNQSRKALPLNF